MKKISLLLGALTIALITPTAAARINSTFSNRNNKTTQAPVSKVNKSDSIFKAVSKLYASHKISADSVVNVALYHKSANPYLAERCLRLAADQDLRGAMELGVIYAFSPEFAKQAPDGIKLLQAVAKAGYTDANAYLGLYYFNHGDYKKAKTYLEACKPMKYGFGDTALGSMYLSGNGVKADAAKAREYFHQAALKGYPRGMALYGFNLRAKDAGRLNYPDSFFWLYISGDLGDDAARTTLFLPRRNEKRGDSEVAQKAAEALEFIEMAQTGKKIQNEPIYKDGFLPSLKTREKEAEQGDDWARFYLGSMNYNGDFLNQNYAQALRYYEPIARNGKLPKNVLALVNERLAEMYRQGKGTQPDTTKADRYTRAAAQYGSLTSYKLIE